MLRHLSTTGLVGFIVRGMGHTISRNRSRRQLAKTARKRAQREGGRQRWRDEELGQKVNALLEANVHRKDAVILPTTSELVQSYQLASRRGSIANPNGDPNRWVRLSFNGDKEHQEWLRDQKHLPVRSRHTSPPRRIRNIDGSHSTTSSSTSSDSFKWSKTRRPRPKAIMNWLRDLEILISDDDPDEEPTVLEMNSAPIFQPPSAELQNEKERESGDEESYSTPPSAAEIAIRAAQSEGCISDDQSLSARSKGNKSDCGTIGRLDLTKGQRKPLYMGASASCRGVKVLPTLPRRFRSKDAEKDVHSPESSTSNDGGSDETTPTSSSESTEASSRSVQSDDEGEIDNYSIYSASVLGPYDSGSIRSKSYADVGRSRVFMNGFSEEDYELEHRKLRLRENMNFRKALLQGSQEPMHGGRPYRELMSEEHRNAGMRQNPLQNFIVNSPRHSRVQAAREYRRQRRKTHKTHDEENDSYTFFSPPPNYGFDPYADAISPHHINRGRTNYHQRASDRRGSKIQENDTLGSFTQVEETSDITSGPFSDESDSESPPNRRFWRRNDQMMSSLNSFHHLYQSPYHHAEAPPKYSRYKYGQDAVYVSARIPARHGRNRRYVDTSSSNEIAMMRQEDAHRVRVNAGRMRRYQLHHQEDMNIRNQEIERLARRHVQHARGKSRAPNLTEKFEDHMAAMRSRKVSTSSQISGLSSRDSTMMRKHRRSALMANSLTEIDPVLEKKMDAMVRDMVHSRQSTHSKTSRSRYASLDRSKIQAEPPPATDDKNNPAVGAIHSRVASALATLLMSKSFPNAVDYNR